MSDSVPNIVFEKSYSLPMVFVEKMFPSTRKSLYKMKCHCCYEPILRGQYITQCCESKKGIELRGRYTRDGSSYKLDTGSRWIHKNCHPSSGWTMYSMELESMEIENENNEL